MVGNNTKLKYFTLKKFRCTDRLDPKPFPWSLIFTRQEVHFRSTAISVMIEYIAFCTSSIITPTCVVSY
jgi:hypothetical protein